MQHKHRYTFAALTFFLVALCALAAIYVGNHQPTEHREEVRSKAYTTMYLYWDNTPPGSADIAFPKSDGYHTLHDQAGGTGTYADPITLAVGHRIVRGEDIPDFTPGTLFYIPNLHKYFIVEDTCGDGDTPQNLPCHKVEEEGVVAGARVQLDLWIDGADATEEASLACADDLTGVHLVIQNPAANLAVVEGPVIQEGRCSKQFGDTVVLAK